MGITDKKGKFRPLNEGVATESKQDAEISLLGDIKTASQPRTDLLGLGNLTVGLTQVEIAITGTPHSIRMRADTINTGIIYIGKTGVLSDGTNDFVRLESGDEIVMDYDDTTNALFAISDVAAQKLNVGVLF